MEKNKSAPQLICITRTEHFGSRMSCANILNRISESAEQNFEEVNGEDFSDSSVEDEEEVQEEGVEMVSKGGYQRSSLKDPHANQQLACPVFQTTSLVTNINGGLQFTDDAVQTSDPTLHPPSIRNFDTRLVPSAPVSRRMTMSRRYSDDMQGAFERTTALRNQMMGQRLMMMLQKFGSRNSLQSSQCHKHMIDTEGGEIKRKVENYGFDGITTTLSAMYAKVIVFMGIVFPITDVISTKANSQPSFYQGFYLYLYLISMAYVIFMYVSHLRHRAFSTLMDKYEESEKGNFHERLENEKKNVHHHASFYLRVGAIAFGIGSMVYSGLELGQYFELKEDDACQNPLIAITPAARILLCLIQMQLIFISNNQLPLSRYRIISKFGLMHLLATNINEWLYVIIEEAKHEMHHLAHKEEVSFNHGLNVSGIMYHHLRKRATATDIVIECRRSNIMGNLVQTAAPFLFPCTIEYSLICAVILFEIWNNISREHKHEDIPIKKDSQQISINCSGSQRGMFGGILVLVVTLISLIMYFVLTKEVSLHITAIKESTICESFIYFLMAIAVVLAMIKMRQLRFSSKRKHAGMSTDCTLLLVAQSGVFIYTMFSVIGCYFNLQDPTTQDFGDTTGTIAEIFCIVETSMQTIFIMNSWWRRIKGSRQIKEKPGRQYITFLLIANMCLWTINTLIKGRAGFRPQHMQVFGNWAWIIITHVSMPLAIFYRFHSSICLYEVWKTVYKMKGRNLKKHSIFVN